MQPTSLTHILAQLTEALLPILASLASWLAYKAATWVSHRIQQDRAYIAMDIAQLAVVDVVAAGGAAFQAALREAAADGVITSDELKAIRATTLAAAKKQAGEETMRLIAKMTSDPDAWLWTKVKSQANAIGQLGGSPSE